jgi:hypothetical protein
MRKLALRISVGLNLALSLLLAMVWTLWHPTRVQPSLDAKAPLAPANVETERVIQESSVSAESAPKPFRWSQLQSMDYGHYISNLRAAACPEKTLRAIVTSDLDTLYENRARELQARLTELQTASLSTRLGSFSTIQALRDQLQQLSAQEGAEISSLLGSPSEPTAPSTELADGAPALNSTRSTRASAPPQMPLVMQKVDTASLDLSPEQQQIIEDLRQNFSDAVGGPDQDPNDPAYLARWQKAQLQIDHELRGMLGIKVFEHYEVAAQPPQ